MTPWPMSEVMAQASDLDTVHVTVGDVQLGLEFLEVFSH